MREEQTALKSGSSPLALSSFPKLLDRLCVFAQRLTRDPPAPHRAVYQSAITREIKSMSNQRKTILWNHEYRLPFPVFFLFFMDIKKKKLPAETVLEPAEKKGLNFFQESSRHPLL